MRRRQSSPVVATLEPSPAGLWARGAVAIAAPALAGMAATLPLERAAPLAPDVCEARDFLLGFATAAKTEGATFIRDMARHGTEF